MPFQSLPALQVKTAEPAKNFLAGQFDRAQLDSNQTSNRLAERSLGLQENRFAREVAQDDRTQARNVRVNELTPAALNATPGSPESRTALTELAAADPKRAAEIQKFAAGLAESDKAAVEAKNEELARPLVAFLNTPDEQKAALYPQLLQITEAAGGDISALPPQFSPEAMAALEFEGRQMMALSDALAVSFPKSDVVSSEREAQLKRINASKGPLVKIEAEKQQLEENKAFGKSLVARFDLAQTNADGAEQAIEQLSLAQSIPIQSGALEPLKAKAGALGEAMGFSPEALESAGLGQATTAQAFTGIMQNLVLTKMQAQKGPQTENDAKRIERTLSNLGNTDAAREFLIRSAIALEQRKVAKRDFMSEWKADPSKGNTFEGAERGWRKEQARAPLFKVGASGLPLFFQEFSDEIRRRNPGIDSQTIRDEWAKGGQNAD